MERALPLMNNLQSDYNDDIDTNSKLMSNAFSDADDPMMLFVNSITPQTNTFLQQSKEWNYNDLLYTESTLLDAHPLDGSSLLDLKISGQENPLLFSCSDVFLDDHDICNSNEQLLMMPLPRHRASRLSISGQAPLIQHPSEIQDPFDSRSEHSNTMSPAPPTAILTGARMKPRILPTPKLTPSPKPSSSPTPSQSPTRIDSVKQFRDVPAPLHYIYFVDEHMSPIMDAKWIPLHRRMNEEYVIPTLPIEHPSLNELDCIVSRCLHSSMVNATKLLNLAGLSRGNRDTVIRGLADKIVRRRGNRILRGAWVPLPVARTLANQFGLEDCSSSGDG